MATGRDIGGAFGSQESAEPHSLGDAVDGGPSEVDPRSGGFIRVANLLAAGAGLDLVLDAIARQLLESTPHTRASVTLWDAEQRTLTMAVSRGDAPVPQGVVLPYDLASPELRQAVDGGLVVVADYDEPDAAAESGLPGKFSSHSSLIAPILYGPRLLGVLSVDDPGERREFTGRERDVITELVYQAAAAIELARLLEREREAAMLGAALAEVDALVHSSLDADTITSRALAAGAMAIGAETGAVIGLDRDGWVTWQSHNFEPSVVGVRLSNEENPHGVHAVTTGETVAVDDAFEDPRVNNEFMKGYGLRSVIVAPITVHGRAVAGLYYNYNASLHRFSLSEIDFVGRVASAMSVALENAERFDRERERLVRAETVSGLLELAASNQAASGFAERALEFAIGHLGADAATLWSIDEAGQLLTSTASSGLGAPGEFSAMFADGIGVDEPYAVSRAYRENRALTFGGGSPDAIPERVTQAYARFAFDLGTLVVLPVRGARSRVGAVTFAWRERLPLSETDLAFFSSLARAIAIGMENERLVEDERLQLTRSELLREVAVAATQSLTRIEVSRAVIDRVSALPDFAVAGVYALEGDEPPVLKCLAASGYSDEMLAAIQELPVSDENAPGYVAKHDADLITHTDSFVPPEMRVALEQIGVSDARWVALPIRAGNRLIGAMGLVFHGQRAFDFAEIAMFQGVAATLGPAIENAELFDDLAETSERLATVLDTIDDAFIAVDSHWRYTIVNRRAEVMLGSAADKLIGQRMDQEFLGVAGWTHFQRAMSGRVAVRFESYSAAADIWVEVHVYPTLDGISMIASDISERRAAERALQDARARSDMLAMLLDDSSQPFMVGDPGGRFMLFNHAFQELTGRTAEELAQAKWPDDVTTPETLPAEIEAISEIQRTGLPQRFEKDFRRKDGSIVPAEILRHGHRGEDGSIDYYYAFVTDISERKAAERREAENSRLDEALSAIGIAVTTTLDSDEILRRLVQLSAEAVGADAACVTFSQPDGWLVRETIGMSDESVRSVLAVPTFESALLSAAPSEPVVINGLGHGSHVDPRIVQEAEAGSLIVVPLTAKNGLIGAVLFRDRTASAVFGRRQVDFASSLASLANLALENARLFERERGIADTLQQALLSEPESGEALESAVVYRPASDSANVGGDFYDVFVLDDGRVCFTVGDVSGKGLDAARLTSVLHDGIRAFAYEECDPAAAMSRVNNLVHRMSLVEQFATAVFGILDPATGEVEYCFAGHPHPVVVGQEGARLLEGRHSPILGGFRNVEYATNRGTIGVGEMIVLYTDGVTEARRQHEMFGEDRLLRTLTKLRHTSVKRMPERLLDAVLEFSGGALRDDTVVLCLRRRSDVEAE